MVVRLKEDFIDIHEGMKKDDRVIRDMYTPKEIASIIQVAFQGYNVTNKLTRSEMLLVWEFSNLLIRRFKDD